MGISLCETGTERSHRRKEVEGLERDRDELDSVAGGSSFAKRSPSNRSTSLRRWLQKTVAACDEVERKVLLLSLTFAMLAIQSSALV